MVRITVSCCPLKRMILCELCEFNMFHELTIDPVGNNLMLAVRTVKWTSDQVNGLRHILGLMSIIRQLQST